MQRLMSLMRSAMEKYHMIEEGDRIAVCVSGGKDSVALLYALSQMRRFYPIPFSIEALTLEMGFPDSPDFSPIAALCEKLEVPYTLKPTKIGQIVFDVRQEENPCSLCARMRRGALHDAAKALGCNKIALGHHLDDAAETFYMNLLLGGRIGCFSPVSYLSNKQLYMIRPMALAFERDVSRAAARLSLPVVKNSCPADGNTKRQEIKQLVRTLEKDYDRLRIKTIGALQRAGIDGW